MLKRWESSVRNILKTAQVELLQAKRTGHLSDRPYRHRVALRINLNSIRQAANTSDERPVLVDPFVTVPSYT